MDEKLLYTSNENLDIIQICQILKENEIPYAKREEGTGQYINISMGTSFQTQKIYVSKENFEEATKLIQNFIKNPQDNEDEESDTKQIKTARNLRKLITFICLGFPLLVIIMLSIFMGLGII